MDSKNRCHSPGTYTIIRAESVVLLLALALLFLRHAAEVNWLRALAAFFVIDLVGYLPGAIAYRRRGGGPIPARYHHLYNLMHNYLVVGAAVGLWGVLAGFEWAMLAVPIHLSIDRGVFGNVLKPIALPFEPVPARADVVARVSGGDGGGGTVVTAVFDSAEEPAT